MFLCFSFLKFLKLYAFNNSRSLHFFLAAWPVVGKNCPSNKKIFPSFHSSSPSVNCSKLFTEGEAIHRR